MTREGQFEYEFAAGKYNGSIRENSKKSNFVLGTLVYGLPKILHYMVVRYSLKIILLWSLVLASL